MEKKPEMVKIYIMGKEHKVPKELTIMGALEYAGYKFIRGAGCRAGFCGACSTIYRKKGEYKLYADLACQTLVGDGMHLVQLPFVPAVKANYKLEKLDASKNTVLEFYPEIARCVMCNTCNKACPQDLEVMEFIQAALKGDIEKSAKLSFDCIQCGLCAARCPADIKHYHVAQLVRRLYGKYMAKKSKNLEKRFKEINQGKYDSGIEKLTKSTREELKQMYKSREIEVAK
jgi:heterodisulfide reductase subunit C